MRRRQFNPFRFRALRERAGLTQEQVGVRMGYEPRSGTVIISRWESGKVSNPNARFLRSLSEAIGESQDRFVTNAQDWFACEACYYEWLSGEADLDEPLYDYIGRKAPLQDWGR